MRRALLVLFGLAAAGPLGCGGGPPPVALENRTFYQYDDFPAAGGSGRFERPYPPLDRAARAEDPAYVGVSVLEGGVRFSRPKSWSIRRASLDSERRYVEYVSPNEYLFAIYERNDSPADPWREVMERYEEEAKKSGAEVQGARVPYAGWHAQGRAYLVRRTVKGARAPYFTNTREVILRGDHRIVVVELSYQGDSPSLVASELLRVMDTIELL